MVKEKRHLPLLLLAAFSFLFFLFLGLIKLNTYGQTTDSAEVTKVGEARSSQSLVKKTASTSVTRFRTAAIENANLKNNLAWTFGAKAQHGWSIYVPLIQHSVGTEEMPETPEFAAAVAAWQQKFVISPSGKIDAETLSAMIKWWQSRRLNSSRYSSEDQLISAPISNFYDPGRSAELLKVERETFGAYRKMVAAAAKDLKLRIDANGELAADEKFLRIVSSFRSREYQDKLRRASPSSGRAGLAVNSPHFTGCALDIFVGGEPTITKDFNRAVQVQTPAYKWLVKNAERFGFYPYFYEPWHWEYVPDNIKN